MIKTVLLDLDDTLLENPVNRVEHSVESWNRFFNRRLGLEQSGKGLARAMRAVSASLNPVENNFDVFVAAVCREWGCSPDEAIAAFQDFYRDAYPDMQAFVQPRPGAPELVAGLKDAGYQVVIATNPFFRPEGVRMRLGWAGLPTELCSYALVTHIQNMQFAKPNPHYYEEILGRLGVANAEAIMVGDDWLNDIVPAERAGLNTFWVHANGATHEPVDAHPDGEGMLDDFAARVRQGWLETLQPRPLKAEMIVPRLLGNVGALFGLLREHAPDYWPQHPDPNEWSPLEVVCHLRDSERTVQRPRLERIAAEDNPFLTVPQAPPGPGLMACDTTDYCDPAEEFAAERQTTVAFLESLPPATWQRPARHSIFGPTTFLEMADFTATHDRMHIQQICQTIGRCK